MSQDYNAIVNSIIKYAEYYLSSIEGYGKLCLQFFGHDSSHQPFKDLKEFCSEIETLELIIKAKNGFLSYISEIDDYADKDYFSFKEAIEQAISYISKSINRDEKSLTALQAKKILYWMAIIAFAIYSSSKKQLEKDFYIIDLKDVPQLDKNERFFYRGQPNSEWRITPSVLRELNKNVLFNDDYYVNLTLNNGLDKCFNEQMRHYDFNSGLFAYQKYAFFQHACSFSPLIDMTRDGISAVSFALSNSSNKNNFNNTDAAVYIFKTQNSNHIISDPKEASQFLKSSMKLMIINSEYIALGGKYNFSDMYGYTEEIEISSIPELYKLLTPDYKIITCATNDRMYYQAGVFICFYNCICLKDKMFYELIPDISIQKGIIPRNVKRRILGDIYTNHRARDPEHLMNPYLLFNE